MKAVSYLLNLYVTEWVFVRTRLKLGILLAMGVFFVFALFSFLFSWQHPDFAVEAAKAIADEFRSKGLLGPNKLTMCLNILYGNMITSLVFAISGLVPFIFIPICLMWPWGNTVGLMFAVLWIKRPESVHGFFLTMFPHGIFELPALFYSAGIGAFICMEISRTLVHHFQRRDTRDGPLPIFTVLKERLWPYFLVVIPLLVIAAVVETFITKPLALRFLIVK